MLTLPCYTTREQLAASLDAGTTLLDVDLLDDVIDQGSRTVETLTRRVFYPTVATRALDWPTLDGGTSWRVWLGPDELVSLTSLTSGGTAIDTGDVLLEPATLGPPYTRLEINLGSSSFFEAGSTWQRNLSVSGVFGGAPISQVTAGTIVEALDATETGVDVDGPAAAAVGIGDLVQVGDERMLVTGREWLATADTATLTASLTDTDVAVTDGTAYRRGGRLLAGAERMMITEIVGNTLYVKRAIDGTQLAAHTAATVYRSGTLTVTRGVLGTTAAAASSGASVLLHRWPALVASLAHAEASVLYLQKTGAYSAKVRTAAAAEAAPVGTIERLRLDCQAEHRRWRDGAI